jgi:hypothetical protein
MASDFDSFALGQVSPKDFNRALGPTGTSPAGYDDMDIVADSRGSGRVLRTTLDAGTIRDGSGNHGAVLPIKLPGAYESACMSYDLRFSSRFDWSLGGKIPGLLGVAPGVSPSEPAGGGSVARGWSGRLMWVGHEAYSYAPEGSNMAVTYLYHPGQATKWGDNIRWNRSFAAGTWHTVKQCHTMNTVGRANGKLQAWLDGKQVVNSSNVVYRTRSDVKINYFEWDIFRGGDSLAWAGSTTGYIDIDKVRVTTP